MKNILWLIATIKIALIAVISQITENEAVYEKLMSTTQPAITCSKLTIETLEQGVKYVQS